MKTVKVNGKDVDAAKLLAALHNNTRPLGMGFLADLRRDMTVEEAAKHIKDNGGRFSFDYVCGRPIKVGADEHGRLYDYSDRLFDRDAGEGSFARAVEEALRS